MFNKRHYSGKNLLDVILFALWIPFGLTLLSIRLTAFIWLIGAVTALNFVGLAKYIMTPSIRDLVLKFFGVWTLVTLPETNFFYRHKAPYIITSNHLTAVDLLPFLQFAPLDVMIDKDFFNSSWISVYFLKSFDWLVEAIRVMRWGKDHPKERAEQQRQIKSHLEQAHRPLLIFPEGWDTNGAGLMVYQKYCFGLGLKVIPIALQAYVPLLPINPGMLGTTVLAEVLWLFFSPMTIYNVSVLPPMEIRPEEESHAFAKRVQAATAQSLGVRATGWHKKDALAYRQSLLKPKHS